MAAASMAEAADTGDGVQCVRLIMPEKLVYLSLGSNLGDREANLRGAIDLLEVEHIRPLTLSSLYETEPQDIADQPWFLNLVTACETTCFPLQLLTILQGIERQLGRTRGAGEQRKGPRLIDLDILLYGQAVLSLPQLTIPHPRMVHRRFVLEPLAEVAPELKHPSTGQLFRSFLPMLAGQKIRKLEPPMQR